MKILLYEVAIKAPGNAASASLADLAPGDTWQCLQAFLGLHDLGRGGGRLCELLAVSGWRPPMLLNVLQGTGHGTHSKQ